MTTLKIITAIVINILLGTTALADSSWLLGVAALHSDGPYLDKQNAVAPLVVYERNRLTLSTLDGVAYRIYDIPEEEQYTGSLSLAAVPRIAPSYGDNSIYDNIDRDHGLDVGITGGLKYGVASLEFHGLSDITNSHSGFELSSQLSYQHAVLPLEIGVGIRYRDENLNQYLFGVSPSESNEQRTTYMADGEATGFISGLLGFPLAKNLIGYLQVEYEDLGALADSPLVSESGVTQVTLAVIYQH